MFASRMTSGELSGDLISFSIVSFDVMMPPFAVKGSVTPMSRKAAAMHSLPACVATGFFAALPSVVVVGRP